MEKINWVYYISIATTCTAFFITVSYSRIAFSMSYYTEISGSQVFYTILIIEVYLIFSNKVLFFVLGNTCRETTSDTSRNFLCVKCIKMLCHSFVSY